MSIKQIRKLIIGSLFGMIAIVLSISLSYADPINVGDTIYLEDSTLGTTNGGEFLVYADDGQYLFPTFCLETDEYISYGVPYLVSDISINAVNGGSGGPDPDPISSETAYLYYHYLIGDLNTLPGSTFVYGTDAGVDALQKAIWYLEEEVLGEYNYLVVLAGAATNGSLYGVQVLNLTSLDGRTPKQSQLVLVPEPSTLLLLGAGLLGLGLLGRKKFKTR